MAQEKSPKLIKAQFLLLGIVMLFFFIWSSRKCSRAQQDTLPSSEDIQAELERKADSIAVIKMAQQAHEAQTQQAAKSHQQNDIISGGNVKIIREKSTPLYVTIENLAIRKGPGLNYEVLDRLNLFDEVSFLNEVTDSLYTITLGKLTATDPWIKVRNKKGRDGWVYGAGVDFYKRKLEGVE